MENKLYTGLINSGKTEKIRELVKEKINNNESLIILDTKHEYEEIFKNKNYEIIKFDLRNLDNSINFNPFNKVSKLYKEKIDEGIGIIINVGNIIFKTIDSTDPFWDNSAKNLYTSICLYLLETNKNLNIKEILRVAVSEFDVFKEYVEKQDILSTISILGMPILNSPHETRGGILSVLNQKMGYFAHRPQLLEKLCTNDKLELKENKQAIIFNNLENPGFPNTILEIIMLSIMNSIYDQSLKYTFILDNYDTINNKELFENLFNNSIFHNIESIVATRNIENIKNKDVFKEM